MQNVTIKIRGDSGVIEDINFDRYLWAQLNPITKNHAIHEKAKHVTEGKPFQIISQEIKGSRS